MSNVTQTSKAAYYHTDMTTQRERVAAYLLQRTFAGLPVSDNAVAAALNIPSGRVSARRNELFKTRYFSYGVWWIPAQMHNKYDRHTGCTCQTWSMVIYQEGGNLLDMKRETIQFITKYKMK